MNVGSLFSGIGGLDLGLQKADHRHAFFCESDPYRRRVLARHWPGVPCFEDVADVGIRPGHAAGQPAGGNGVKPAGTPTFGGERIGLLCGGFPCQDLSVAGRRAGLDGSRSGLFFEFARVADALLPDGGWVLIENVPGLLSSNGGRDFAVLLATLGELGFHDLAWRVLDSRYLGVPQRRRRVFILARRAGGRRASEVLLEPESGGGDFEAGREPGERLAAPLTKGSAASPGVSYPGRRKEDDENLVAGPLTTRYGKGVNTTADDGATVISDRMRATPGTPRGVDVGAFHATQEPIYEPGGTPALGSNAYLGTAAQGEATDRSAFDPRPDGPRYAACGDAVTVNVAEWIGHRLKEYA